MEISIVLVSTSGSGLRAELPRVLFSFTSDKTSPGKVEEWITRGWLKTREVEAGGLPSVSCVLLPAGPSCAWGRAIAGDSFAGYRAAPPYVYL